MGKCWPMGSRRRGRWKPVRCEAASAIGPLIPPALWTTIARRHFRAAKLLVFAPLLFDWFKRRRNRSSRLLKKRGARSAGQPSVMSWFGVSDWSLPLLPSSILSSLRRSCPFHSANPPRRVCSKLLNELCRSNPFEVMPWHSTLGGEGRLNRRRLRLAERLCQLPTKPSAGSSPSAAASTPQRTARRATSAVPHRHSKEVGT
jgi:hypothetical protein